jgi:starch synthase
LIIKVASIPRERIQVYFIDNDEYFKRKATFTDEEGVMFPDNDERAIFFAKGVVETVKKLKLGSRCNSCTWLDGVIISSIFETIL